MGGGPSKSTVDSQAVQTVATNMNSVCNPKGSVTQNVTCDFVGNENCSGAIVNCINDETIKVSCDIDQSAQAIQKAAAQSSAVAHSNFLSGATTTSLNNSNWQNISTTLGQICDATAGTVQNSYNNITCDASKMSFYLGNKYQGEAQCALAAVSSAAQASSFKGSGTSGDAASGVLTIIFSIIGAIIALVIIVYIVRNLPTFNIKVKSDYVYSQGVLQSKNGEPVEGIVSQV